MKTERIYLTDAYTREFYAKVTEVNKDSGSIVLEKTAFYPGGGGQPADRGWIHFGGITSEVIKAAPDQDKILHFIHGDLPEIDQEIEADIDWDRRYKLMRTHTAMHILCGVVWRDYKAQVTGGNMEPLAGRMDFEFENMSGDLVREIEDKVNEEVVKASDIEINILPREEAFKIPDLIRTKINLLPENLKKIRIVEIKGLDLQADGGTHVKNTREVGIIHIPEYKSKGKINKRLKIALENTSEA